MATVLDEHALVPNGDGGDSGDDFLPDDFPLLDVYDERPASIGQARPDALATISAGKRVYRGDSDKVGFPQVSRDGTIYLHDPDGRAPGLAAALKATDCKSLTVAFPFSDVRLFWQERFARYSQTRLEVYGDETELREILLHGNEPPEHRVHLAGTPEYDKLRRTAKVTTSLYFGLATWEGPPWIPRMIFPDGLSLYRLRTTSRHSRRSLLGALQTASRFTGGALAGLPFELRLSYREVADPTGAKRTIPVWSLLFKPPSQISLTSQTWVTLRDAALAEGRVLASQPALQAPRPEGWQLAEREGDVVEEPSDADLQQMLDGDSPADEDHWRRVWFSVTDHTIFSQDHARHQFIKRYTGGETASLAGFLKTATNSEADAMIRAAVAELNAASAVGAPTNLVRPMSRLAERYEEIYGGEDKPLQPTPPRKAEPEPEPPVIEGEDSVYGGAEPEAKLDYVPEPTPFDDVDAAPPAVDEADEFYPESEAEAEQPAPDAPPDADIRAYASEWLAEVHRQIADAHKVTKGAEANGQEQRIIANLLVQATEGDVGGASKLLRALTKGAPGATSTARKLTRAQAQVLQSMAARDEWADCVSAVVTYGG